MKICNKCKVSLPIEFFSKNKSRKDGRAGWCKQCWNEYYKSYYKQGKEKARLLKRNKEFRISIKKFLDEVKNVPCADCGQRFPACAMDFDHLEDKDFGLSCSYVKYGLERIKKEIAKCEVVCANCHRIRTYTRVALLAGAV